MPSQVTAAPVTPPYIGPPRSLTGGYLVAFDPDASFIVHAGNLLHRNPVTPYAGKSLRGVVTATWLRGRTVTGRQPCGRLLTREDL